MTPFNMTTQNEAPPRIKMNSKYADIYAALEALSPDQWLKITDLDGDDVAKIRSSMNKKTGGWTGVTTRVVRDASGNTSTLWITKKPV